MTSKFFITVHLYAMAAGAGQSDTVLFSGDAAHTCPTGGLCRWHVIYSFHHMFHRSRFCTGSTSVYSIYSTNVADVILAHNVICRWQLYRQCHCQDTMTAIHWL